MRTVTIDQHTFCPDLLTETGWLIDVGCRGFNFSNWMIENAPRYYYKDYNFNVYAIDIEHFEKPQNVTIFKQAALTNYKGSVEGYFYGNGTGNFIKGINGKPGSTEDRPVRYETVPTITLKDIYAEIGKDIDLLKLDIEGSEYMVLDQSFEPIPKQITVECHEHCHRELHDKYWPEIFERLCKDYHASLYISEWPQYKFMDCLFIRKDIA